MNGNPEVTTIATEGGVGGRLKLAIHRRGLGTRQAIDRFEIAKVPGSSQGNFYRILKNETEPKTGFIIGASSVLGVSAGWLLTGEGDMAAQEPLSPEDVERLGLFDLPELIQDDVVALTQQLYGTTDRSGLTLEQRETRIAALSQGIAAWLRIPLLHSDKFRRAKMERGLAIAFCDVGLRALRLLIREPGDLPTPGSPDRALAALAKMERGLAGRDEVPKDQEASDDLRQDRGDELRKVEVARLSEDQKRASELLEDHRTQAGRDERQAGEKAIRAAIKGTPLTECADFMERVLDGKGVVYDLVPAARDGIAALRAFAKLVAEMDPPAAEAGTLTRAAAEHEEFTPEEREALAELKRQRKAKQKEAARPREDP